jgi:restriction system protein
MLPLLRYASDRHEHGVREAIESLAHEFDLSDTEKAAFLPSGQQAIFDNRVHWAVSHLKHAGLLERTRRVSIELLIGGNTPGGVVGRW